MVKQLLGAALSLARVVVIADAIEFATELAFIPTPAMADTVTVLQTGAGGPGNGVDFRPCSFFQVNNQQQWYALPDSSPHKAESWAALHDSISTGGGIPVTFFVGNPVTNCDNWPEAVDLRLGVAH